VTGQLQIFAANDDDLSAAQDLLGDDGCKTAKQVTATVDDDSLKVEKKIKEINKNYFEGYVNSNNLRFSEQQ
jgi:hypothetical protein